MGNSRDSGQLTMFPSITSPCHSPGTLCFCPTLVFPFALLLLARPPPIGWNFGHCSILIAKTPPHPHPSLPFLINVDWFLAWHIYKPEQPCDINFAGFNVLFPEQSGLPQGKENKKSDNVSKIFFPNDKNYQDFFVVLRLHPKWHDTFVAFQLQINESETNLNPLSFEAPQGKGMDTRGGQSPPPCYALPLLHFYNSFVKLILQNRY